VNEGGFDIQNNGISEKKLPNEMEVSKRDY